MEEWRGEERRKWRGTENGRRGEGKKSETEELKKRDEG